MEMPEDFIERCNVLDQGPKIWAPCMVLFVVSIVVAIFLGHAWEQWLLLLLIFSCGLLGIPVGYIKRSRKRSERKR
jgi:ABC-type transport system involved in cytochrome bd biosynthesis fused ATPase/permease subunit